MSVVARAQHAPACVATSARRASRATPRTTRVSSPRASSAATSRSKIRATTWTTTTTTTTTRAGRRADGVRARASLVDALTPHNIDAAAAALAELPAAARMLVTGEIVRPPDAVAAVADAAATMTTSSSAAADAALGAGGEATAFVTALAPKVDRATEGFSIFRGVVSRAQEVMGLTSGGVAGDALPTGGFVETLLEPGEVIRDVIRTTQNEASQGATISASEWDKVVNSVDVDLALLLASVVTVVPLCKYLNVSPVLGFLGVGLLLNQEGLFSENEEVDQFCELGIQFLLFEMGLELSVSRLKALGKYAFGLGLNQVLFVNLLFAAALLPAGDAIGTKVLGFVQNTDVDILQINSSLQAVVIGFALSLSSSALGLQLLSDKKMMPTRVGTASLGVLLFQDLAVVPFIILLPLLQSLQVSAAAGGGAMEMDYGIMAAETATSFLDLGVLSYAGYFAACWLYKTIVQLECGTDVFVACSLLVLFGFSNATSAIGFSDSLGAFLAGLCLAGTPYAHDIMKELRAFKGLFLSLFFVTIGTTIDLPLAIDMFPIVATMTLTLMVVKTGVVTALGPFTGLTWREALVAGAFMSQGGEFAFVIFGQATSGSAGSLFPANLDELLVVVVIASMALTPVIVDVALKIAGPELNTEGCEVGVSETFDEACAVVYEVEATRTGKVGNLAAGSLSAGAMEGVDTSDILTRDAKPSSASVDIGASMDSADSFDAR